MWLVASVAFSLPACAEDETQTTSQSDASETSSESTPSPAKLFEPRQFRADLDGEIETLNYRLLKPQDFKPNNKYPLVVFLHGAGERGADNTAQLKHGVSNFCSTKMRTENPCYVLAPQCPKDQSWADIDWTKTAVTQPEKASKSLRLVMTLIDEMLESASVDRRRVYLTGLSMGGFGTWDALARRPGFFAAAIPVCGGGDLATAPKIANVPIWCFHGAKDRVVTVELSRKMIEAIKQSGGEPKYIEYPDAGHDSWTATYSSDEVLQWMFAQRLKAGTGSSPNGPATEENTSEQPEMKKK
ncbi:MAG TPA: phospholipase [Planctomycetaceae bacterium]|nr:phospholipase [Planctomycetaceae bacterium]